MFTETGENNGVVYSELIDTEYACSDRALKALERSISLICFQ